MKNYMHATAVVVAAMFISSFSIFGQVTVTTARVGSNQSTTGTFIFPPNTVPSNSSLDLANGKTFRLLAGVATASGSTSNLTNGTAQTTQDAPTQSFFSNDSNNGVRVQMDLESVRNIERIGTYSWHTNSRAPQFYRVYGATSPSNSAPNFTAAAFQNDTALAALGYTRIAEVRTATTSGGQFGATVTGTIGQYRYILFDMGTITSNRGTFYGEIDIYEISPSSLTFPLTIMPAVSPQTGYDLQWISKPVKSYHLRTSTDLASPIREWQTIAQNIPHTQPLNRYNVPQSGPRRFYAVEENPALPLLSATFEDNNGGFTVATTSGSAWEYGAPTSGSATQENPGGFVSSGAENSLKCWGSNIANPGYYIPETVTRLRSPVIDLTNSVGANLHFYQALDLASGDMAVVNIIDDTSDTVIASTIYTAIDSTITSAKWASVGPISLGAGVGQKIRVEWMFSASNAIDYMGWYIDNVTLTESAP